MVNSRIRTPFYIFFLNPVYVAARSLRSLRSNNITISLLYPLHGFLFYLLRDNAHITINDEFFQYLLVGVALEKAIILIKYLVKLGYLRDRNAAAHSVDNDIF